MHNYSDYIFRAFTRKKACVAFFNGAVVLLTLYLVSTYQVTSILLPIEQEAYALKIKYEHVEGKKFKNFEGLGESECKIENKSYESCAMAVHLNTTSESAIDALMSIQKLLKVLAIFLLIASFLSFMLRPLFHKEQNT